MHQRSGDGRFIGRIKIVAIGFTNFEMLDARIASALNKIIQNSYFKKKVSTRSRQPKIAFMIYDYFRVTGAHDTILDYVDLFSVTLRDDKIQEFDTRWDEVLLSMPEIPSDDVLESLYKLRIRESAQLKTVLDWCDLENHQKISVLREYQKNAGNGKQKDSVRKEIIVVSCTMRMCVENRHHCALFTLNHRQKGW